MAVLDPVKLVHHQLGRGDGQRRRPRRLLRARRTRSSPSCGQRDFKLGRELWIERTDYEEVPPKGFFRLFPGNKVRLKYGHVIECTGCDEGRRRQA